MKILIVDDSLVMRRIISNVLKSAGYDDFVEADNGVTALEKLDGIEFILTDWNMPGMDGLSFVREVRKNPDYASLPIVMVTTEGTKDSVLEALKSGVDDYIVKPFSKTTLIEKIENVISKK